MSDGSQRFEKKEKREKETPINSNTEMQDIL